MGLRHWFREIMGEDGADGGKSPGGPSLVDTLLGRGQERKRAMGEYSADSYPAELREKLAKRQDVATALLQMDITDVEARKKAIPRLRELLRIYPHPLAYETLIHAYVDLGKFDEAKGVAFAAKQRRLECSRSEYPEIRSETDSLREWTQEDIDEAQNRQKS